nr:terpene synthase family protein [Pseudenhygromyxa sp. WMMC2535]
MLACCYRELGAAELARLTQFVLWIFALDDAMDEAERPLSELGEIAVNIERVLLLREVRPAAGESPLCRSLVELRESLPETLDPTLVSEWVRTTNYMVRGMLVEAYWRKLQAVATAKRGLPSFEDYMSAAWYSVGVPPMVKLALALLGAESPLEHGVLERAVLHASRAVRLANDLQTYEKELAEGCANAVTILAQRVGVDAARARIAEEIAEELQALEACASGAGVVENMLARTGVLLCDFYTRHDYHTFGSSSPGA